MVLPLSQADAPPVLLGPRPGRRRLPRGLVAAAVVSCALVLLPLGHLVAVTAELNAGEMAGVLLRPRTRELFATTLGLGAAVGAGSVVLGVGAAWMVGRLDFPGRRAFAVLVALPLAVPSYVAAYTWLAAVPDVQGFGGAALVLTLCCYPFVYLPVLAALRGLDPALEDVARAAGHLPRTVFRRVVLPQLRPAMTAGGLLAVTYVLADFGSVAIMRVETLTRTIATSMENSFTRLVPTTLSLLLVVVTALVVTTELRTRGRARFARVGSGAARRGSPRVLLGAGRVAVPALLGAVLLAALGVPLASLAWWLTAGHSGEVDVGRLVAAAATSLGYAGAGAAVTVAVALPVGLLAGRHPGRAARSVEAASWLPRAVPAVVVALSLVYLTVRYAPGVYLSPGLLVGCYAVLFLPLAVGAIRASAVQAPPSLEEAARSLGHGPAAVLRRVTLPLTAPGLAAGALLVFLSCLKELTATLVLHPTGTETLALRLWTTTEVGRYAAAAPYAAVLVLLAVVPNALLIWRQSRRG